MIDDPEDNIYMHDVIFKKRVQFNITFNNSVLKPIFKVNIINTTFIRDINFLSYAENATKTCSLKLPTYEYLNEH